MRTDLRYIVPNLFFWHIQIVSRFILGSLVSENSMESHFFKSDSTDIWGWFEMRFECTFLLIYLIPDTQMLFKLDLKVYLCHSQCKTQ